MNIEPRLPTWQGPTEWFTGDVYLDPIHVRKAAPSRMAALYEGTEDGDGATWLEHVTDDQYAG
ncbi:MAG: hypothetical protein WCF04_05065 [Candidatus Nanopelagicales bacterium]